MAGFMHADSYTGFELAALAYSRIDAAKLNSIDPQAYLITVFDCIAVHLINIIDELPTWNFALNSWKWGAVGAYLSPVSIYENDLRIVGLLYWGKGMSKTEYSQLTTAVKTREFDDDEKRNVELLEFEKNLPPPDELSDETSPSVRMVEREYYKILRKQNIRYNEEEKKYYLRYFANNNPDSQTLIPLSKIKTVHSNDDDELKYPFARFCYMIVFCAIASLYSVEAIAFVLNFFNVNEACAIDSGFLSYSCGQMWVSVVLSLSLIGLIVHFAYLSRDLVKNFIEVDANWRNSIDQFFAPDVLSKMNGVRLCMLTFRQFIKWRRFANFFKSMFIYSAGPVYAGVLICALVWTQIHAVEIVFSALFLFYLIYPFRWFFKQRHIHTEWRDPTVQLCVMIAELHQQHVDTKVVIGGQK